MVFGQDSYFSALIISSCKLYLRKLCISMAGVLHIGHTHAYGAAKNAAGKGDSIIIGFHISQTISIHNEVINSTLNLGNESRGITCKTVHRNGARNTGTCKCASTGSDTGFT